MATFTTSIQLTLVASVLLAGCAASGPSRSGARTFGETIEAPRGRAPGSRQMLAIGADRPKGSALDECTSADDCVFGMCAVVTEGGPSRRQCVATVIAPERKTCRDDSACSDGNVCELAWVGTCEHSGDCDEVAASTTCVENPFASL